MEVTRAHPFRIVRDADIEIQELEADDLLETMQQNIRKRKFGSVVQVAVYESMPENIRELLVDNLEVSRNDVYVLDSPLGLSRLWQLYNNVERHDLKDVAYKPRIPKALKYTSAATDIFDAIRNGNILLHHPYNSFNPVVDFLNAAARDPHVLAIKQTLYRVGTNAPVVEALLEAAERGKQVAVLVELKARFDEESNIGWARALEEVGVHVVYGLVGLKTHCKVTMVVRQEGEGIRRYLHLATGNYNALTSRIYEDIGLFTCDEDMGADATDLFNYLTGYSTKQEYRKLLVAPVSLRKRLEKMIQREIEHAQQGRKARLIFKANSLVDPQMIQLALSGVTGWRAGGSAGARHVLSASRHQRRERKYPRHQHRRALSRTQPPVLFPQRRQGGNLSRQRRPDAAQSQSSRRGRLPRREQDHIRHLRDRVLETYLKDNSSARILQPDGTYIRLTPEGKDVVDVQEKFMS